MPTLPLLMLLAAAPPSGAAWSYDVSPSADLSELAVEATFASASRLEVDRAAEPFVRDVQRVDGEKGTPLKGSGPWELPGCARGCRVRYRFQLRAAAERLNDPDEVMAFGATIESSPGAWLLRPDGDVPESARYRLRVRSRGNIRFATGLPSTGDLDTYEGPAASIAMSPYSALGPIKVSATSACATEIQVAIAPGRRTLSDGELQEWAITGARQVCQYLEPVVRARAGALEPEKVWGDLVEGLPKGELRSGEDGLDEAPRWGPTYWGGALFWLKLDLEIRRHTKGERSLREALRAVNAQG